MFSIVESIRNNFVITLSCLLGYFPAGSIWMIFKWLLFLHKFNDARKEALEAFHDNQESAKLRAATGNSYHGDEALLQKTDREALAGQFYKTTSLLKAPRFRDYKAKLAGWVCFWVFSVVGTLVHDIARRISLWIVNRFSGLLQWMSNKIVGDIPELPPEKVTDNAKP